MRAMFLQCRKCSSSATLSSQILHHLRKQHQHHQHRRHHHRQLRRRDSRSVQALRLRLTLLLVTRVPHKSQPREADQGAYGNCTGVAFDALAQSSTTRQSRFAMTVLGYGICMRIPSSTKSSAMLAARARRRASLRLNAKRARPALRCKLSSPPKVSKVILLKRAITAHLFICASSYL